MVPHIFSASNLTYKTVMTVEGNGFLNNGLAECYFHFWEGTTSRKMEVNILNWDSIPSTNNPF